MALSNINAIECIMVPGEYGNGYQSRLMLKLGEHVFLTRSYASRVEAPETPPFKIERILWEKLMKEISQQDQG